LDLTPYLGWIVFIHVAGAFLFAAGHGVALAVAFRVRREREPQRMLAMLDLSASSLGLAGVGLLLLLVGGILAGIVGGYFGQGWIWLSLVMFIVIGGLMTPLAGIPLNRVRLALGQRPPRVNLEGPDPVARPIEEVTAMLDSRRPELLAAIGGGGFFVILWLMMFKPF
jgi:uncharacterized membrane protein